MDGCESWITKAEHWRIDAFELWCWRRPLRVPWTARRSNQSILREISPEYPLEGLKLKFQYFGHLMRRADSLKKKKTWCWEILKAGEGDDRGWDGWMASPIQWTQVSASSTRWWRTGKPGMLQSTVSQRVGGDCVTEQQQIYYMHQNRGNTVISNSFSCSGQYISLNVSVNDITFCSSQSSISLYFSSVTSYSPKSYRCNLFNFSKIQPLLSIPTKN